MRVTIQYYDGAPANAAKIAADAKQKSDAATAKAEASPQKTWLKTQAADARAAYEKAAEEAAMTPTDGLREQVKAVADQHGLVLTSVDAQHETIEVSGMEQAKLVMADMAPIANIQTQTAR